MLAPYIYCYRTLGGGAPHRMKIADIGPSRRFSFFPCASFGVSIAQSREIDPNV